jgi:hypothetical protein
MLSRETAGLADDSKSQMHAGQKPICVFPDGSYAFRTQKQVVYVDRHGHAERTTFNDHSSLMGEEKAQVFALSEANMDPSPSFRGGGPAQTPDEEAVLTIYAERAHADEMIGAAVREERSPSRPIVVQTNETLGNVEGAAQTVADHFDVPVQVKMDDCTVAKAIPEMCQSSLEGEPHTDDD